MEDAVFMALLLVVGRYLVEELEAEGIGSVWVRAGERDRYVDIKPHVSQPLISSSLTVITARTW